MPSMVAFSIMVGLHANTENDTHKRKCVHKLDLEELSTETPL